MSTRKNAALCTACTGANQPEAGQTVDARPIDQLPGHELALGDACTLFMQE